eukprot:m.167412 g.167412  ORF g.167412 m.167412 type:complete len:213 (+) comp24100_c0_seq1:226-864(+)
MDWLFGRKKTPAEMLKEHQRALKKSVRGIEREERELTKQQEKLKNDIKKSAKEQQMSVCRIQAKDLVRTKKHIRKMLQMKTQIQAVSLKIQTMKSTATMADAMKGVSKAMGKMNKTMNMPQLTQVMRDFERESGIMDAKQEMMDDMIDGAMEDEDDEQEADDMVQQVLEELGLAAGSGLADAEVVAPVSAQPAAAAEDENLMARLNALRKDD